MEAKNGQQEKVRQISIIAYVVMLALLVPLTVFLAQQENNLRSNAASSTVPSTNSPTFGVIAPCPSCDEPETSPVVSGGFMPSGSSDTAPTSTINNPGAIEPCDAEGASLAHNKKKKSKHKKHEGAISQSMEAILKFLIELINLILQLFGGTPIKTPVEGTPVPDPKKPEAPEAAPCQPQEEETEPQPSMVQQPSVNPSQPAVSAVPSGAAPSGAVPSGTAPSGAPSTSKVPVGSKVVFVGDYNTGDFSQWSNCQWQGFNGSCGSYGGADRMAKMVNDGPGHETAARFEVQPGDVAPGAGGERSEVRAAGAADVKEGDERWYEFSLKADAGFKPPVGANSGGHSIVMQWHSGSGSPPFHVSLDAAGNVILWHRWDSQKKVIGPLDPGNWHDYVLHVKFSSSSSTGFVEAWRDGKQVVPKTPSATMSSSSNYLKMGLYRGGESFPQVIYHDGLKVTAP